MGFIDFRVRVYGDAARIQLPAAQLPAVAEKRLDIIDSIKPYFPVVLLDLETRSQEYEK